MRWRFWLIDLPARIVGIWFTFYYFVLTVAVVGMLFTGLLAMALYQFGIRWGW